LNLKEQSDLGNRYADKWLACALERLRTEQGRALARQIAATDHTDWWFLGQDEQWWKNRNGVKDGQASGPGEAPGGE
jgi:putative hydrolase of HD superfamily